MRAPLLAPTRPRKEATGFQEDGRKPGMPLPTLSWMPAPFDKADVAAMKALREGTATGAQQQRALAWIVEYAARTYVNPFVPDSDRASSHGMGCMHVGNQIVKLLNWRLQVNDEQGR